ncbi:TraR/DksA C4-type zinc finger protein [Streptomyces sp. LHD-70]|uniref:TraR/DksA family transcriptional regulator n=1 Tax=Streptomyces sp. LHD-70 TaxID=3072140 RepID=UPI00280E6520|nr:TraR/DksA C4-type zinc finger protein [Streptomyces sp. LHD-70]MDQ8705613.1 TraR/DksA C4-type zinc finger protein [Streptomyces sp. LHD-70]
MVNHQTVADRTHAAHLSAADLVALRKNLDEQRLFRQEQLRELTVAVPARGDAPGRQRAVGQVEVGVRLAACARMVLVDVEAALTRLSEGRYGICQLCRRPVARKRLMIVPQARYCGPCQQVKEAGR